MRVAEALKAVSFLWLGSVAGAGFVFLCQVVLARSMSAGQFGLFVSTVATVTLLTPVAGFGIAQYWLKVFGEHGAKGRLWLPPSLKLVAISTSICLGLVALGVLGFTESRTEQLLLLILSVYLVGQVFMELLHSVLQIENRSLQLAVWHLLPGAARFTLVVVFFLVLGFEPSARNAALLFAAVAVVLVASGLVAVARLARAGLGSGHRLEGLTPGKERLLRRPRARSIARQAWPFGIATLAQLVYHQSDIILIKHMVGNESAGIYNVAFTVMAVVFLLPSVVYQKFLLYRFHRWARYDFDRLRRVFRSGSLLMAVLGICATLLIWAVAGWFVPLFFGPEFADSVGMLRVLACSAPLMFVAFSAGAVLTTQQYMKLKVAMMIAVALINVGLNLLLIPIFGAMGAAYSTVACNFLLLVLYLMGASRVLHNGPALAEGKTL